jgi:hypothetical protein
MNKEKMCIIFLIILGLIITLFLGGRIFKEGFTSSDSTTFIAVPVSDPNSPKATVTYPNNDMSLLNFNLNNQTVRYNLTNSSTTKPITYTYNGNNNTTAILTILKPTNIGPDANIKQTLVITDSTGKKTAYGSMSTFIEPPSTNTKPPSTQTNPSNILNTNYDNYNHYNKTSSIMTNETTFYGPNGGMAVITTNSDGTQVLKITLSSSEQPIIFTSSKFNISGETFYGPNGGTATIVDNNGKKAIILKNNNGVFIYKLPDSNQIPSQYDVNSTQYFGSTGYTTYPFQSNAYTGQGSQSSQTSSQMSSLTNTIATALTGTTGTTGTTSSQYSSALPPGVPLSQIPKGQEDLYILKSEVVPPVCPACPAAASCPRQEPCPACPPCGRCPEPSFECKKVPNYNAINNQYLPAPFVNSFSSFGR